MAPRRGLAAVVTSAAVLAGGATATAGVPEREREDARAIAVRVWGEPCTGRVQIRFQRLRHDTLGMARWKGMWDIPSRQRERCTVLLNSRRSWDWRRLCTTIVHEYGHLAGRSHSERRHSAMRASYSGAYSGCVRSRAARRWDH